MAVKSTSAATATCRVPGKKKAHLRHRCDIMPVCNERTKDDKEDKTELTRGASAQVACGPLSMLTARRRSPGGAWPGCRRFAG